MPARKPQTLGELKQSGYQVLTVRQELRKNLIDKIRKGETLFPGILGYEDTVIPHLENAILAGHDIIMLGERGQAKTRLIRSLINLLDEEIPVVAGCEINDNPFEPVCKGCRSQIEQHGDKVAISWLGQGKRYGEKLATPDTTIADLIGEVDPIKVAEGKYLSDELTIHYGLVPRTNRGIFCINELPDLAERIQVGLFNILEERDVQIRGYKIRLPLDIYVVASANPEDYTSRGRIITPLKDRYGSEIRTHYPRTLDQEIAIVEQERIKLDDDNFKVVVPRFMQEIIAEFTDLARKSREINQRSGVSVRVSIANYETMIGNALRRSIRLGEKQVVPRISDLPAIIASTMGKIEVESVDEGKEAQIVDRLLHAAVLNIFSRYFTARDFEGFVAQFSNGLKIEVSENMKARDYAARVSEIGGLSDKISKLDGDAGAARVASAFEFILEGLHLSRKLNKDKVAGKSLYRV
ncbi:MAG: magnesium chelatase [Chloroflexi bacterium]|nr:magnesium chelatase [Chloroflexota bacterium]